MDSPADRSPMNTNLFGHHLFSLMLLKTQATFLGFVWISLQNMIKKCVFHGRNSNRFGRTWGWENVFQFTFTVIQMHSLLVNASWELNILHPQISYDAGLLLFKNETEIFYIIDPQTLWQSMIPYKHEPCFFGVLITLSKTKVWF